MRSVPLIATIGPLLLMLATGCVGVPFATPPLQATLGTGVRSSSPHREDAVFDIPLQVRAAVHPLALAPSLVGRRADFGVGYLLDAGSAGRTHGTYLEASGVLAAGPIGDGWGRLSLRLQGRLLFDGSDGRLGQGAALQLTGDYGVFVDGPFDSADQDGGAFGYSFGEGGVGFYLEAAGFRVAETAGWSATTGLLFRLPASVGFAWTWLSNVL
ncbi:MAG TPA: hypothetical protein DFS52_01200 [Myxococcales bacterium]|nr:hypothetical protein [Myxococcales bacterium]